ncbi:MAG: exo-alpha-sialidase [Actinobacteria bacterium]|nr:exo-alpha-sialidase [Actinomycetota bacterium]
MIFTPAVQPSGTLGTGSAPVPLDENTQSNASPAGLAVTSDGGAKWSFVKPSGVTWNPTDHGDFVDPVTNRVFFEDYGPIPLAPELGAGQEGPAHIMWTDAIGDPASWHHTAISSVFLPENPRFTAAPAPPGQPAPAGGYPNVIYFCANTNVGFVSPVIAGRVCFKSLDGGSTFNQTAILFTGVAPQHAECGTSGEIYSAIDGYYPQPAPDGSLYVMVACGGATYLARSADEAATFPIVKGAMGQPLRLPLPAPSVGQIGSPDLRIGPTGTMYLMWSTVAGGGTKLMLSLSRDRGLSWTRPLDVTAPRVSVNQWAMAERNGHVAVAYLGRTPGQATMDAYMTETRNAGDVLTGGQPLFWSAVLNTRPVLYGDSVQGSGFLTLAAGVRIPFPPPFGNQMFGNDFIGATIAPDGSAWGSFGQDCGPSPDDPTCQAQNDQTRGFAGRLLWAPRAVATPSPSPTAVKTRPLAVSGGQPVAPGVGLAVFVTALALTVLRRRGLGASADPELPN